MPAEEPDADDDQETVEDDVGYEWQPAREDPGRGLIEFAAPSVTTPESALLVSDIVDLDHRSLNRFGMDSDDRRLVAGVLTNAASLTSWGDFQTGRILFERSKAIYSAIVESQNRVTYLRGVLLGLVPAAVVAAAVTTTIGILMPQIAAPHLVALICLFSAIGSVTSVLTRLSTIALGQETSKQLLLVSGIARPAVAVSFSVTIFLILQSNLIDLHLGGTGPGVSDTAALAVAFVVGFSERFAKDVIARVAGEEDAH